jgi:3-methylcrotonyl-CoA carboxylase alpha subunit
MEADRIGYPVLIKASAGGGGKGMRVVDGARQFDDALASAQREAAAAFGDERVLIEKYLTRPRHIEMQVFADMQGQRGASVRARLLGAAPAPEGPRGSAGAGHDGGAPPADGRGRRGGRTAVGYVGAGTVEFIADERGEFYFMEMNTRCRSSIR